MADNTGLNLTTNVSVREIDEVISQFGLFSNRLSEQETQRVISELPKMTEADLIASGHQDDVCPICFNTFLATLAEEEFAHAMDSVAHPVDDLGVTKLQNTCGHMFCRKDIMKWVTEGHDSCPSCRRPLVTREERRNVGVLPQLGESWPLPWLVDSETVARDAGLPSQLLTLSIDSLQALGVAQSSRHQSASMYS